MNESLDQRIDSLMDEQRELQRMDRELLMAKGQFNEKVSALFQEIGNIKPGDPVDILDLIKKSRNRIIT